MKKISNILFASGLMMVSLIVGGAQSGCNAKSEGGAATESASAAETGAEYIISTDMSCLMHIDGCLKHKGTGLKVVHLADVLASGY